MQVYEKRNAENNASETQGSSESTEGDKDKEKKD
jgi:hypothetical protein